MEEHLRLDWMGSVIPCTHAPLHFMHKVSLLKLLEDDPLLNIHMNRKPVLLHTVEKLTCSSGDIGTSKNFTVDDNFRQGVAGLSALHTKGYKFNYPGLTERKQIFDNCQTKQ